MSVKPTIPTLAEIRDRMNADTAYYLPGSASRPHKSLLSVLNTVFSGAIWSVYGFANWMLRQVDPLTADEAWLKIWGDKLGTPRKSAVSASGYGTFYGDETIKIPAKTLVQSIDQRRFYTAIDCYPGELVQIIAESAGYAHNLPVSIQSLTLVNPITGVQLSLMVGEITGGADQESLSDWAQRINEKLDQMQQIGDADDYVRLAKSAHTAIEDAWAYGNTPRLGDITIYCLLNRDADVKSTLSAATSVLGLTKNVGANIFLAVPISLPVDIRIAYDGFGNIPAAVQTLINTDIDALFLRKRQKNAYLYPEEIDRVIKAHFSENYTLLSPTAKVIPEADEIMKLNGAVVYE